MQVNIKLFFGRGGGGGGGGRWGDAFIRTGVFIRINMVHVDLYIVKYQDLSVAKETKSTLFLAYSWPMAHSQIRFPLAAASCFS